MHSKEPIQVARLVKDAFENIGFSYAVVGSLASSLHGVPRSTQDVDIIANIEKSCIDPFVEALEEDFYIDKAMVEEAVNNHSSFNLIHLETMLKVDVFALGSNSVEQNELKRAERYLVDQEDGIEFIVAKPEDVLIQKLKWYRQAGEVSDQQWKDVLGILEVQEGKLDAQYLEDTAQELGVQDLLLLAVQESETDFRTPDLS
ncbi:hypothetical protein AKJ51_04930 [candidate division MSBL1 archaeon SCGC-AAA382A20]|uniref:Uncharacterized protein n=1 Tax=candidate division MSBL1 archaeon SCGC-AAA382A20 TaxID=1698280 RepID=A0A133VGK9_9EURY|nr:hypothetical protein AKJ51_04930 [candidate division MSBL1 archaeon SCGC-AAA382A20]